MASGQRIACDSSDSDVLSSSYVPIVVIPGVMGSRLKIPGGSDWDPDYGPSMTGWLACSTRAGRKDLSVTVKPNVTIVGKVSSYTYTAQSQDAKSDINADSRFGDLAASAGFDSSDPSKLYSKRGWGGVAWDFYGSILMRLEIELNHPSCNPNGKHPVYGFGYDWRQSNAASAKKLVDRVNGILKECPGATQVILLTHSMGGLVARYACTQLGLNSKVLGVIHTVQPSNGAVICYRRFSTGCSSDAEPDSNFVFNTILGDAWWKYTAYMSGLRGPMELLPNARYSLSSAPGASDPNWLRSLDESLDLTAIYSTYEMTAFPGLLRPSDDLPAVGYQIGFIGDIWDSVIVPELRTRIRQAGAFHDRLDRSAHPTTYVIYTDGELTDEAVEWQGGLMAKIQTNTGDGTVPSLSGGCFDLFGVVNRVSFSDEDNLKHSLVFKNDDVCAAVLDNLQAILSA